METHDPSNSDILAALDRAGGSQPFQRAARHRSLLRYLVEKKISGKADDIKEFTIALEVFGRESYDPQVDSQVRVEVGKLRERLDRYYTGEGSGETLRIEIPKGSYEPVFRTVAQPAAGQVSQAPPGMISPERRSLRWILLSVGAAAVLSGLMWAPWRSPTPSRIPTVVVLPFEDFSPNKDLEYLCGGLSEELSNKLTSLQIFRVLPRSWAAQYKGKPSDAREIGRKHDLDAVVEGSVRKADNRIRIAIRLVDARQGLQFWAKTYDHQSGSLLDIEREVAESVARAFHLDLPNAMRALVRQRTRSVEAYHHYLRGSYLYAKEPDKSIEFYRAAVSADPGYALAWAGLANAWSRSHEWNVIPTAKSRPEALAASAKALSLDIGMPEAHHSSGIAKLFFKRDWRGAEESLLKAIELDPAHGEFRSEYARLILTSKGRFSESVEIMRKAVALEPMVNALHNVLANTYLKARQYEAAIPHIQASRKLTARAPAAIVFEGIAAHGLGRPAEALQRYEARLRSCESIGCLAISASRSANWAGTMRREG